MALVRAWALALLIAVVMLAALFAAWQAITVAWISTFANEVQLALLQRRFWLFVGITAMLLVIDVILIVRLIRRTGEQS